MATAVLAAACCLAVSPASAAAAMRLDPGGLAALADAGPSVDLRAGELMNAQTGAVLWVKSPDIARPMGSIAKVMTALIVLEAGDLNREITVTKAAIRYVRKDGASSAGLIVGDVLTVRELLAAMLIPSGCDAAYLLATAYGPGRAQFIAKMNATAAALGMTSTHFTSFDGMPYPTETSTYSTPGDLIKLGLAAMRFTVFRQIVATRRYYLPASPTHHSYLWDTTNMLIGSYAGVIGIKTGDTKAAGNCLLFEADRNGVTLIGVVLHANPSRNPGSAISAGARVLNWGFSLTG